MTQLTLTPIAESWYLSLAPSALLPHVGVVSFVFKLDLDHRFFCESGGYRPARLAIRPQSLIRVAGTRPFMHDQPSYGCDRDVCGASMLGIPFGARAQRRAFNSCPVSYVGPREVSLNSHAFFSRLATGGTSISD